MSLHRNSSRNGLTTGNILAGMALGVTGDRVYMDGSERGQSHDSYTTSGDANLWECLGNTRHTQVVGRCYMVLEATAVLRGHGIRYLGHQ